MTPFINTMNFDNVTAILADGSKKKLNTTVRKENNTVDITIYFDEEAAVKEFILFDGKHGIDKNSRFYGDGYSMLSQYGGTLSKKKNIGGYSDKLHYRMPQTKGYHTSYNYVYIKLPDRYFLVGAASCKRFRTEIRTNKNYMQIVQCAENIKFCKGEQIQLESMFVEEGYDINDILSDFSEAIARNHKPLIPDTWPTGWCSWYCLGPSVTEKDIFDNLIEIGNKVPSLKYVQIDDGFQPYMGDWLETGRKFGRDIKEICLDIKKEGFEPAVWLAPFIASKGSRLLKEHPDYFVKDEKGNPLCSGKVTFSGWRDAPWYFLDGTNEGALRYIEKVFRTIYEEWGVKYFKLDANVWGAMPFGERSDKKATSVEAYRRGMETAWRAVGSDAYILGCNAPMWPSLGLVSGMRVTGDVSRNILCQIRLAKECFHRNWMNGTLWLNDPDCLLMSDASGKQIDEGGKIKKDVSDKKFYKMNTVYVRAGGGVVLSGDFIGRYTKEDTARLARLMESPHHAAVFDDKCEFGIIDCGDVKEYCLFNYGFFGKKFGIPAKGRSLMDMYSGESIVCDEDEYEVKLRRFGSCWIKSVKR